MTQRFARVLVCMAAILALAIPALAQTGTIAPVIKHQFFTNTGAVCNGCLLHVYEAGTTTEIDTFSDAAMQTPNQNPIVLDSAGRATIYLAADNYKFILATSADVPIWTQDNVGAVPQTQLDLDITGTAGEALTARQIVYLSDGQGSLVSGRWYRADADQTYSSSLAPMIGMVTADASTGESIVIRLQGRMTGMTGLVAGSPYYVSATAGAVTATAPTALRQVGYADTTTTFVMQPTTRVWLPDSNASHALTLATSSNLTANRTLTLVPGDADRTLTLSTNVTLDQDVSTTSSPTWNIAQIVEGRLTGTTAVPVTTTDVSATANLYWTPYRGNRVAVYDGSSTWTTLTFSEITISISSCTASTPYDVFVYNNSGTLAAETLVWTNATTRATALTTVAGVWVKSGQTTRRYVGSFYCNATGGQTDDTLLKRYIYNAYNQRPRPLRVADTTDSWSTAGAQAIRQARAQTANQVDIMIGLDEQVVDLTLIATMYSSVDNTEAYAGFGCDSVAAYCSNQIRNHMYYFGNHRHGHVTSTLKHYPGVGRHYYAWLESTTDVVTFYGDDGGTQQSGIYGISVQ